MHREERTVGAFVTDGTRGALGPKWNFEIVRFWRVGGGTIDRRSDDERKRCHSGKRSKQWMNHGMTSLMLSDRKHCNLPRCQPQIRSYCPGGILYDSRRIGISRTDAL
jgi:hypothetical protein